MNIRDLRYVVAVAEEGHFGRAAIKCHVSQPALSGQIRKLEETLDIVLFERTKRSVRVTPAGARIVDLAQRLIVLADEIVASARAARDPLSGPFGLGMIATIGPYLSPLILASIRAEMPDLAMTLVEGFTADLERRVVSGDLDAVILATAPEDPALQEIALYDEPFRIAVAKGHRLASKKVIDLKALAHEELLLLADGHCLRDQVLDLCSARTGMVNANTRETGLETLLALVAAGDGVTLVPALTRDGQSRRNIVLRPEASHSAGRVVRLVCRKTFPRMELVDRLAAIIRLSVPAAVVRVLD